MTEQKLLAKELVRIAEKCADLERKNLRFREVVNAAKSFVYEAQTPGQKSVALLSLIDALAVLEIQERGDG